MKLQQYSVICRYLIIHFTIQSTKEVKMKKVLVFISVLMLLATSAFADTQPDTQSQASPGDGGVSVTMKGIHVTLGGFIAAEGVYRSKSLNSDVSSKFAVLPLPNQPAYYQDETRFTARQTRLSLLAQGDYNPAVHLAGFYEMDFLGAATTANSTESNSYNPRIRHLYATTDWDNLGLHLLAGQSWSLVTMNNRGITPRNEYIPLVIDAQYVPGFSWARQPQVRIVKDWDKTFWLGISAENPQTLAASTPNAVGTNYALSQAGGGSLTGVSVSNNDIPDFVVKAAYEPSWGGHFEVFDLIRSFKSTLIASGAANNNSITTNAVGGGIILPVFTNKLTFQLSGMYGSGIGRYGSGQLPDVTQDVTGKLDGITELQTLAGLTWNPTSDWTFYTYYGMEQAQRDDLASGGKGYGYGSALYTTLVGAPGTASIQGQVQRIDQFTIGTWWKFYQGSFGKMQLGLQYSYTDNEYFSGKGGAPQATDNMVFTSLRYYW
jgi:hypothetical protein